MTQSLLCNMGDTSTIEACRPLHSLPCWTTPVEEISGSYLAVTHRQVSAEHCIDIADDCMNALTAEATKEFILGEMNNIELVNYVPPNRPMTVIKFKEVLSRLSHMEIAAVLYALDNNLSCHEVIVLLWKDVKYIKRTPFSRKLLKSLPVNINCPFVFWKYIEEDNIPRSVSDLSIKVSDLSGLSWGRFAESVRLGKIELEKAT